MNDRDAVELLKELKRFVNYDESNFKLSKDN